MFKIGDYVAHYKEGVCEVVNIGKIDMGSSDKEYYTLKPVYDAGGTVYTPVDNKRDQIRKLITKEEAENLIKEMPKIDIIGVTNEKQREGMYKNALLHNQCREWIDLIRQILLFYIMMRIIMCVFIANTVAQFLSSFVMGILQM